MHPLTVGLLLSLLLVAALHDIRTRRIPNTLVLTGAVAGLLSSSLLPLGMGGPGILDSLFGLAAGLLLLLPLYLARAMGAGDVKLMSMIGAFLGAQAVVQAFIYILLAGGLLALGFLWWKRRCRKTLPESRKLQVPGHIQAAPLSIHKDVGSTCANTTTLPYGVAIALGTIWYLFAVAG